MHAFVRERALDGDSASGGQSTAMYLLPNGVGRLVRRMALASQSTPEHPGTERHDDGSAADLQPPDRLAGKGLPPDQDGGHGEGDHDQAVGRGGSQAQQHGIMPATVDPHQVGGRHGLGVAGFQGMQRTQADGHRKVGDGYDIHAITADSC
jgi:hypothetical protein